MMKVLLRRSWKFIQTTGVIKMSFQFMKDTTEQAKQKLLASNWESMQDADQSELERIELMRDELRRDEPVEQESEEREYCFSRADTL